MKGYLVNLEFAVALECNAESNYERNYTQNTLRPE